MEPAAVRGSHYLRYWHPTTNEETGYEVAGVSDVVAAAELVAGAYREAHVDYLPGIALWRGADVPQNALGIGIAADGWAIVHTDEEFFQQVTRSSRKPDGIRRNVQFDEFLEIPSVCFIAEESAVETVAHWMATGELLDSAGFSDDLFSC